MKKTSKYKKIFSNLNSSGQGVHTRCKGSSEVKNRKLHRVYTVRQNSYIYDKKRKGKKKTTKATIHGGSDCTKVEAFRHAKVKLVRIPDTWSWS